jgi:thiamine biosynthesis protein ThiS
MSEMIRVVVNGQERSIDRSSTGLDLLRVLDLDPRTVVVELNKEIVRRPSLGETRLHEGDRIEIVHFVGGG